MTDVERSIVEAPHWNQQENFDKLNVDGVTPEAAWERLGELERLWNERTFGVSATEPSDVGKGKAPSKTAKPKSKPEQGFSEKQFWKVYARTGEKLLKLEGSTVKVYLALALHANREQGNLAWPSQKTLARICKLSDRQVRRALDELTEAKFIEKVSKGKTGKSTRYRVPDQLR